MTMKLISTVTVGSGGQSAIEFSSIPQTATDLFVVFSLRDSAASAKLRLNNTDSTGFKLLYGTGSSVGTVAGSAVSPYIVPSSATVNTFGNGQVYIARYTGSQLKSAMIETVQENNDTSANQGLYNCLFGSSAVNSLSFVSNGTGFVQYSTASLYTIEKGSGGATVS